MIVIAIIGIPAAVAITQFNAYRIKGYNSAAKADAKNAYKAAQAYFVNNPSATIPGPGDLTSHGYRVTSGVQVTLATPTIFQLVIISKQDLGTTTYRTDVNGLILP
jgi:type II secretory pathway pseudopilin PulG